VIHETEYYKEIVRGLGWNKPFPAVNFPISEKPEIDHKRPILGICNGLFNTASWHKKAWPNFERLCQIVKDRYHIVKVGFANELKEVKTFDTDYVGKLTMTETAKVISQCDKFVTTDSSCMHVAAMLGIDTVALFGGTYIFKNAPLSHKTKVLYDKRCQCRPCQDTEKFFSCREFNCMKNISPERVAKCL
jgi:ADP-heptose:LPS heptosyltransferase